MPRSFAQARIRLALCLRPSAMPSWHPSSYYFFLTISASIIITSARMMTAVAFTAAPIQHMQAYYNRVEIDAQIMLIAISVYAKSLSDDMQCPHCGSNRLTTAGLSHGKQNYRCGECLHRFTPEGLLSRSNQAPSDRHTLRRHGILRNI